MESITKNKIYLLDCTLRDGGYVNNWKFGSENAKQISQYISKTGVDFIELGFIRNCEYDLNKIEFNNIDLISNLFYDCTAKIAVMLEVGYDYSITNFPYRKNTIVDMIRLSTWKRSIQKCFDYAKKLINKGYKITIQLTRIELYDYDEFKSIVNMFSSIKPFAIYIVDTFGLLTKNRLLKYALIINENADKSIFIGYHAHNNMQLAYCNAIALIEHKWNHNLIIDATIMGIGRGAGNLCLELIEKYLNDNFNYAFNYNFLLDCAEKYIKPIYKITQWGYSIPYFLSAKYGCNPSYVLLLEKMNASINEIDIVFNIMMQKNCGVVYNEQLCKLIFNEIKYD